MTHYPVTSSWYRGIREVHKPFRGQLRRACDWMLLQRQDASYVIPSCEDCRAYKYRIETYWRTVWRKSR